MGNDFFVNAILSLLPEAQFHASSGGKLATDNSILEWFDEREQPTVEAIQSEMSRLQAAYNAQAYSRSRESEYPSLQDCIHAILDNDLDALQLKRQAV